MSIGAVIVAKNHVAKTALEPAANLSFGFDRDICTGAYMAPSSQGRARRACVAKMYLFVGGNWPEGLCVRMTLGDRVRVEEEAHPRP